MRLITLHIVNPVNDKIAITVMDASGAGGANHHYEVQLPSPEGYDPAKFMTPTVILFPNGPIAEAGINGLTQEVLLAICADRAIALTKIQEAMMWLQRRTLERMRRGVEGTMAT